MSLNYLATRFTCSWPWETLVMLCDGRVVCGCADPYAQRVLGDVRVEPLGAVWTGGRARTLREELNAGGSTFCGDCPLKLPLGDEEAPAARDTRVGPLPSRLYIECTAACNISCLQACCAPETGITRTRQTGMLDYDLFKRVVDEAGPSLGRLDFFNYGEAFLHKRAVEMCEYIKANFPHIYLYTSTNGLMFTEDRLRRLAESGIDEVTFSLDGALPESYAKYRQRGDLNVGLRNLRTLVEAKRRAGRDVPFINWRYILFTWNDNDEEMNLARELAADIGVDRLCWEITDHPEDSFSRRFTPGTPDYQVIKHEIWDNSGLGNAIPGATPRARIDLGTPSTDALVAKAAQPLALHTTVENLSSRPFPANASYGRRLVRLGAQLCAADGTLLERDYARAWLPGNVAPGTRVDVPIEITAPPTPGQYALKFDLVCEGIDWFEACGSETTSRGFLVQ